MTEQGQNHQVAGDEITRIADASNSWNEVEMFPGNKLNHTFGILPNVCFRLCQRRRRRPALNICINITIKKNIVISYFVKYEIVLQLQNKIPLPR